VYPGVSDVWIPPFCWQFVSVVCVRKEQGNSRVGFSEAVYYSQYQLHLLTTLARTGGLGGFKLGSSGL